MTIQESDSQKISYPEYLYDKNKVSPCSIGCPAGINIPGFISLILNDNEFDAYRLIKNNNPFPAVTGRVCPHPCEDVCNRLAFDKAVSICNLKALAADKVQNFPEFPIEKKLPKNGKSVGIVGAGGAGLTCAYYLARKGYDVIIYESLSVAGGMMAVGIPEYRLPMEIVQWEVDVIKRVGVEIKLNTKIGKDIQFAELEEKHDAIFLAMGLPTGTSIHVKNEEAEGVYQAVQFLREVKLALHFNKKLPKIGKKVVVVGGGNVAIDALRTARRMGAEAELYCLEQRDEMPAWQHEVNEALEEGACIENGWGPEEIVLDKKGKVVGITFKQCTQVFNEEGRFAPQFCVDELLEISADTIIMAVGQSPDTGFLQNVENLEFFRGKWLVSDPLTMATKRPGVFAGGDVLKPGLLVDAIAHGRKAAISIDRYLGGDGKLFLDYDIKIPTPELRWHKWAVERTPLNFIDPKKRETTFEEMVILITPEEAKHECDRCLACETAIINHNKCMGCGTCVKNCPWDAISFNIFKQKDFFGEYNKRIAIVDPSKCHTCGTCVSVCPINAISFKKWSNERYFEVIRSTKKEKQKSSIKE